MADLTSDREVNAASNVVPTPPEADRWEPLPPRRAVDLLRDVGVPWYVAGGWALDLLVGHETRAHGDLDIAILRGDEGALHRALAGWELFVADRGTLTPWSTGNEFPADRHTIWAREPGRTLWQLEFSVERREGERWSYRRDTRIGAHVRDIGRRSADGIPYLRPEIVLLYKSKQPRGVDETDLIGVLPLLDVAQRATLYAWISAIDATHHWLVKLK